MGKISDESDKVFRVSLTGKDVNTCEPEECAVHSGFDYPKIEESMEGFSTVTFPSTIPAGTTTLLTITHNYGYVPFYNCYLGDGSDLYKLPLTFDALVTSTFFITPSTTDVKIQFYTQYSSTDKPAGGTFGIKYQIWVND